MTSYTESGLTEIKQKTLQTIESVVIEQYFQIGRVDITHNDITSEKQKHIKNVFPRVLISELTNKHTLITFEEIGLFCNKDHSSISHSCKTMRDMLQTEPNHFICQVYRSCSEKIKQLFEQ